MYNTPMRKRRRPQGSLSALVKEYQPPAPSPKKEVIRVEAVPVGSAFDPIGIEEDEAREDCRVLSLFGCPTEMPDTMSFEAHADGRDGFQDKRVFGYHEGDEGWSFNLQWSARGTGSMPYAFRLLGAMKGVFNQIGNLMMKGHMGSQQVFQGNHLPYNGNGHAR